MCDRCDSELEFYDDCIDSLSSVMKADTKVMLRSLLLFNIVLLKTISDKYEIEVTDIPDAILKPNGLPGAAIRSESMGKWLSEDMFFMIETYASYLYERENLMSARKRDE
jgi:hypothetical protein